jgi:hypothetical protein
VKLPAQVGAVLRQSGAGSVSPPPAHGIDPCVVKNEHLEGEPDTDFVEGAHGKGKVKRIYCRSGYHWSYCAGIKTYECCPNRQDCKLKDSVWQCV